MVYQDTVSGDILGAEYVHGQSRHAKVARRNVNSRWNGVARSELPVQAPLVLKVV